MWSPDSTPYPTNSIVSRFPIAVVPASLYLIDANGINLTVQAVTAEIVSAFDRLSQTGVHVRDLPSMGATSVPLVSKGFNVKFVR